LELLPDGTALRLQAGVGWKDGSLGSATVGAGTDSQAGYTLRANEPVIVQDLRTETRFTGPPLLHDHRVVSGLSVIIQVQGRPFGVLGAHTTRRRTFTQDDVHFLQAVANVLAMAIERQRAEEALAHALKERESIMDTIPDILYVLDLGGNLVRWNRKGEIITGFSPSELRGRPALEFFAEEDRAIIAEAIRTAFEQGYANSEGRLLTKDGTLLPYHWTGVPLVDGHGNVIGLTGVGRDISERKHTEATRQALYQASVSIQEPLELKERLDRLLQTARDVLHLDRLSILLADPEGQWLEGVAALGTKEPAEALRIPIGPAGVGLAEAYHSQQTLVWDGRGPVPESWRLKPPYDRIEAFRSKAFAIVPLVVQGRAIGVMGADRKRSRRPLEPTTLELLQLFAGQAAIAIQNARLFEQVRAGRERLEALSRRLVEVQEAERRHIARELHDEIGQVLTGLKLYLEMSFRSCRTDEARSSLAEAQALLNDLMVRVRDLALDLRPAILDDLGLLPALLWHAERYTQQTKVNVDLQHMGLERRFVPDIETAAFRIVQEALTNVARHAGAPEVTVRAWADSATLHLQIEDKGNGFDAAAVMAARRSSGLVGMQERAVLVGGRLTVESAPGRGTRLAVELPLGGRVERRARERGT
jgi:PAS domain S-box-containing protein